MQKDIFNRVLMESEYLLETKKTIREIAEYFKVSKSTVHKDLTERLLLVNKELYKNVDNILTQHFNERHIRGGEATKSKYKNLK